MIRLTEVTQPFWNISFTVKQNRTKTRYIKQVIKSYWCLNYKFFLFRFTPRNTDGSVSFASFGLLLQSHEPWPVSIISVTFINDSVLSCHTLRLSLQSFLLQPRNLPSFYGCRSYSQSHQRLRLIQSNLRLSVQSFLLQPRNLPSFLRVTYHILSHISGFVLSCQSWSCHCKALSHSHDPWPDLKDTHNIFSVIQAALDLLNLEIAWPWTSLQVSWKLLRTVPFAAHASCPPFSTHKTSPRRHWMSPDKSHSLLIINRIARKTTTTAATIKSFRRYTISSSAIMLSTRSSRTGMIFQ